MSLKSHLFFKSEQPREIWILFFGWLTSNFAFAMVIPFISIYFLDVLNVSPGQVGLFFAIATLVRSVSQLVSGEMSDRWGRRRLMYWGQYLRGFTFFLVIPAIYYQSGFFTVSMILYTNYFFGGIYQTVGNASVSDWTTPEKRLEGFAFTRIGGNLGWALGPMAGGFLSSASYELLFFIAAVTSVISGGLIFYLMPKDHKAQSGAREKLNIQSFFAPVISDRTFRMFCIASFLLFICVGQIISTFAVYSHQTIGISNAELGIVFSVNGFMIAVFQLFISSKTKKFNQFYTISFGSILFGASYAAVGFLDGFLAVAIIMIFITIAEMITIPSGNSLVSVMAPSNQTGRYMGIYSLLTSIAWSLAPVLGTGMMDLAFSDILIWLVIGSFGIFASLGFLKTKQLSEQG